MTDTVTAGQELQGQILDAVRKSQEMAIEAIKTWADALQPVTSAMPPVTLPLAGKLPKPEELVESTYDFAGQLLARGRRGAPGPPGPAAPPCIPAAPSDDLRSQRQEGTGTTLPRTQRWHRPAPLPAASASPRTCPFPTWPRPQGCRTLPEPDRARPASSARPARPPCRRPLPEADQAPAHPRRPHQRIRTSRVGAQVMTGGRLLEPHRLKIR